MWVAELDAGGRKWPSVYVAVDLKEGGYAVFLVHRNTREWWRLVGMFTTWERARSYAEVENDCASMGAEETPGEQAKEEVTPAPVADLPPLPASAITPERLVATVAAAVVPALESRKCERGECDKAIPNERLSAYPNVRYCSPECKALADKERKKTEKLLAPETPVPAAPPRPTLASPFVRAIDAAAARPFPKTISVNDACQYLRTMGKVTVAEKAGGIFLIDGAERDHVDLIREVNQVRARQKLDPVAIPMPAP